MHDPAGRDALILRQCLTAENLEAATEVLCSRTSSQLQYLRQVYHSKFGVYLEHEIERYASGDHKKVNLLVLLVCVSLSGISHIKISIYYWPLKSCALLIPKHPCQHLC